MVTIPPLFSIPTVLYSLFILAILALWTPLKRPIVPFTGLVILFIGVWTRTYDWFAPAEIISLLFLIVIIETTNKIYIKWAAITAAFILAFCLSRHFLPGFHNIMVLNSARLTTDAAPFTMYWNFDKPWVALILLFPLSLYPLKASGKLRYVALTALSALVALLVLSYGLGHIQYEPKIPEFLGLWIVNNLFITCIAEEALFRGFLQRHLTAIIPPYTAIGLGALIFGLLHIWGGWQYVLLSTVAGLFYGYQYHYTKKLELAILTHFCVNLVHLFFFTYPALAR